MSKKIRVDNLRTNQRRRQTFMHSKLGRRDAYKSRKTGGVRSYSASPVVRQKSNLIESFEAITG